MKISSPFGTFMWPFFTYTFWPISTEVFLIYVYCIYWNYVEKPYIFGVYFRETFWNCDFSTNLFMFSLIFKKYNNNKSANCCFLYEISLNSFHENNWIPYWRSEDVTLLNCWTLLTRMLSRSLHRQFVWSDQCRSIYNHRGRVVKTDSAVGYAYSDKFW